VSSTEPRLESWIRAALTEARRAAELGEVPVGALLVLDDEVVARGHNTTESSDDPAAHAEIHALRAAGAATGDWRLEGSTLVVTLEPCPMCMGAIIWARVARLVYGAADPRYGACGSALDLRPLAPHLTRVDAGILAEECGELLRGFFRRLRD